MLTVTILGPISWFPVTPTCLQLSWNLRVFHLHITVTSQWARASQITSLTVVYSTVYSNADQRKHQSSASLAFEWGIHRGPVNSLHKWPVTRKMFPFDDVIFTYSPSNSHTVALPIVFNIDLIHFLFCLLSEMLRVLPKLSECISNCCIELSMVCVWPGKIKLEKGTTSMYGALFIIMSNQQHSTRGVTFCIKCNIVVNTLQGNTRRN